VIGDRVAQLGIVIASVDEGLAGPAALPGPRVGVQGALPAQLDDSLDAQQAPLASTTQSAARNHVGASRAID